MYANDLLPHNLEAEEAVLGGVLLKPESIAEIAATLLVADFYRAKHAMIWKAMLEVYQSKRMPEQIVVAGQIRTNGDWDSVGGMAVLVALIEQTPNSIHNTFWASEIKEASRRRDIIQVAGTLTEAAYDNQPVNETVEQGVSSLFRINQANRQQRPVSATELYDEHSADLIADLDQSADHARGATTGFVALDRVINGWQKGLFYIVGARTSMGKTTFAANNIVKLAISGKPVLCCTLETTRTQMMDRMVFAMANVDSQAYRQLPLDSPNREAQRNRVLDALDDFDALPLWITDQRGLNPTAIRGIIHTHIQQYGEPALVVVDYLNLVGSEGFNKSQYERVSDTVRRLKDAGGEMDIPLVVMAQLNRSPQYRTDSHRPTMSDFRDSGAIEEVASTLLGLHRESYYTTSDEWSTKYPGERYPDNEMEVHVLKQQLGPQGMIKIKCDMKTGYMDNMTGE